MRIILFLFFALQVSQLTTSCATKEQAGTIAGAITGAAIGSHIGDGSGRAAAIFFGAVIGSEIGRAFGQHMDYHDHSKVIYALENNKTHEHTAWRNPDTGHFYEVKPTQTYSSTSGPCREFTIDVMVGGKEQQLYGTACRQNDGSWKVVK